MRNKMLSCFVMGIFFIFAGVNHFLSPGFYQTIMPPFLPWPIGLIYISGVAEILGGIGVLVPRTRRVTGWFLIALLIAVFPANIYAVTHGISSNTVVKVLLLIRLPFQAVLIAWVYKSCIARNDT